MNNANMQMCKPGTKLASTCAILLVLVDGALAATPRARDLGIPFDGEPGPLNAITDVKGVTVGQVTLIESPDPQSEVRTGITAILPRGRDSANVPVFGGWFALNGAGEMTGTSWIDESGQLEGPVMLTNTHSVGIVHHSVIAWRVRFGDADPSGYWWSTPVVAETWDGDLNDINGFHVRAEHVDTALSTARDGPVEEGNVGAGTGVICHEFKCGIGTASRRVKVEDQPFTVGVLVQANHGTRDTLRIAGVPVGKHLREHLADNGARHKEMGSIIIVMATDAPLLSHQLKRVARRASLGLARDGSFASNGSGEIFVAFSTANAPALAGKTFNTAAFINNGSLDPLFLAAVDATEEAIVNAMVAARDMRGQGGYQAFAIPHDQLRDVLKQYNRLR
jgi:D-aminopeptidase